MAQLKELQIKVEAYAVQKYGFDHCFDAVIAAFGEEGGAFASLKPAVTP